MRELFRRVLFNVAVANRDDHLRNHGFICQAQGWRRAPAFDMNPSLKKDSHVLALDDASVEPDLGTVMATAGFYRVSAAQFLVLQVLMPNGKYAGHQPMAAVRMGTIPI